MKNFLKFSFMLAILTALAITPTATQAEEELLDKDASDASNIDISQHPANFPLRGISQFLKRKMMTCDKHPKLCRTKSSLGKKCCKKKCVDAKKDRSNCGKCSKKCKFSEICCKGKCVKVSSNNKHCGHCDNKCKKRSKCVRGMCSNA